MSPNVSSTSGAVAQNVYAVDLNNDGVLDLVQDTLNQPNGFTVSIANGDGTFKAPVFYSVPDSSTTTGASPTPIAIADFNNDGKVDVVVAVTGTNQLEVFLGNGDGTLQAPKTVTVVMPTGYYLAQAPMVAADFNRDGNIDLVVEGSSNGTCCTNVVYVLEGNGAGSFANPLGIYTATGQHYVDGIVVGDFDGDGKADIALTDDLGFQGSYTGTTLAVLYGNGDFTFDTTTPYIAGGSDQLRIAAGDLNGDGKTDLYGVYDSTTQELAVFYAGSSRTFASYFTGFPSGVSVGDPYYAPFFPLPLTPELAMADFNGDQKMDIALASTANSGGANMIYALAGANPGEFTFQTSPLPNLGSQAFFSNPVVASESNDTRPNIVINQSSSISATSSSVTTQRNSTTGYWGNCTYPKRGNGIGVCSPVSGSSSNPVNISATANSFGQLRKIELWVDGTKISEQHNAWEHNAWFASNSVFASGTHNATLFSADVDNRLSRLDFSFTVGSSSTCAAPASVGVNICAPVSNSAVSSPVQVAAAAKIAGTLNRMEIWVDGVKKFTETTSLSFSTTLTLPAGSHSFAVYAVNSAGTKYLSTVNATVK